MAILPFSSVSLKGLIKCFEIKDPVQRGGAIDSSITLLFNEANDPIFYKYINNFDEVFDESINKIAGIPKADKKKIQEEMNRFQQKITNLLTELRQSEILIQKPDSFPMEETKEQEAKTYRFKIIVCGDPRVGKTSTILRFTDQAFRRTYIPTIGVNISEKRVQYKENLIDFIIWDIAGQSKFQMTRKHFYKGAQGQLLVFDLTRPETFKNIPKWYQDIKQHLKTTINGLILGNKNDLIDQRMVFQDEIKKLTDELELDYFESSALSGENIDSAFSRLGELILGKKGLENLFRQKW